MKGTEDIPSYEPFKPGEEVILTVAGAERRAVVIADRGLIGHRYVHTVAVRTGDDEFWSEFETPARIVSRVHPE